MLRYFGSGIVFVTLIVSNTLTLKGSQLYPVCRVLDGPKLFPVCICFFFFGIRRVFTIDRLIKKVHLLGFYRTVCVGKIGRAKWKI